MNPPAQLQLKRPLPTSPSNPAPPRPSKQRKTITEKQQEVFSPVPSSRPLPDIFNVSKPQAEAQNSLTERKEKYTLDVPWDPAPSRANLLHALLGFHRSPNVRKSLRDLETPTIIRAGDPMPLVGSQGPNRGIHSFLCKEVNISRRPLIPIPMIPTQRSHSESIRGSTADFAIYVSSDSESFSESEEGELGKKRESKPLKPNPPPLPKFSSPPSSSPPRSPTIPHKKIARPRSRFGLTGSKYGGISRLDRIRADSIDDRMRRVCNLFQGDLGEIASASETTRRKGKGGDNEIAGNNVSSLDDRAGRDGLPGTSDKRQYIGPPMPSKISSKDACVVLLGLGKTSDSMNGPSRMVNNRGERSGIRESAKSQAMMRNKKSAAPPRQTPAFSLEDVLETLARWEKSEKQRKELEEIRCKTDQTHKTKDMNKDQEKKYKDDYQKTNEESKIDRRGKDKSEEQSVAAPRDMSSEELKSKIQRLRDKIRISEEKSKMLPTNMNGTKKIDNNLRKEERVQQEIDGRRKYSGKIIPDEKPQQSKSYQTEDDLAERKKEAITRIRRRVPFRYQGNALGNAERFYEKKMREITQAEEEKEKVAQFQAGPSNATSAKSDKVKDDPSECLICSEDIFDVMMRADEHGGSEYALWACELVGCGSVFCVTCAKAYIDRMKTSDCPACTREWDIEALKKQYKVFEETKGSHVKE